MKLLIFNIKRYGSNIYTGRSGFFTITFMHADVRVTNGSGLESSFGRS